MSELHDAFRRHESEIAANVSTDAALAARLDGTAVRRRRVRQAGVAASALVGLGAMVGGILLFAPAPQNDPVAPVTSPSSSASASSPESPTPTPTATAAAAPEPSLIEGYAPVPQLPWTEIPWGEVGPGWFMIDYRNDYTLGPLEMGESAALPQLTGGLSLVSPEGQWYAASSLGALGAGQPLEWDGEAVWMARSVEAGPDNGWYDLDLLRVRDGAPVGVVQGSPMENSFPIGAGKALAYPWGGDGLISTVSGVGVEGMGGCMDAGSGYWGWETADMSFLYSPDRGGRLVCFGPAEDSSRTAVTLVSVSDVSSSRVVNEFQYDISHYAFVGWVDADRFLLARTKGDGTAAEKIFIYDLEGDSLVEMPIDLYDNLQVAAVEGYFDQVSQRHVIERFDDDAWSVGLYALDGSPVAQLDGECAGGTNGVQLRTSGGRLMIVCADPGYAALYDLATGFEVGRWDLGTANVADLFDHPDE